jgi:penicillin-binding protein-related factor A (putative recombinase)
VIKQGNRGKSFESLIVYSINQLGTTYVVRLRESIKGTLCLKCKSYINLSNKARKQPFDYFLVHKGRPFAVEAKSVHGTAFPFRNIKDHQIEELSSFENEGSSHVFIEFIPGKRRERSYFLVPIAVFVELMNFYSSEENERKSLPIKKLDEYVESGRVYKIEYTKNEKDKHILRIDVALNQIMEARWLNLQ